MLAASSPSDLRARYGRGRLRLLKWLLDPFALVGVYLLLAAFVLDRQDGAGTEPGVRGGPVPARDDGRDERHEFRAVARLDRPQHGVSADR